MILFIQKRKNHITLISGILLILAFIFSWLNMDLVKDLILIVTTVLATIPIAIKAFQALRMKAFSIELLVFIAVIGALYIQEYTESAVVTFLFLFGAYLEARTLEKTRSSLKSLMDMAPKEANVMKEGHIVIVSVDDVREGDQLIVRSGGQIPVDGMIIQGKALINEASITGESVPASKSVNDKVFGGTILDNGYIEMIAEKVGSDTTFAKIIELVEEAQEGKSKVKKFLDKFANIYTPSIVILAIVVYFLTFNLHLAITFLVVACPGALVIGAPVSTVAGIGNGARHGVLLKGGEVVDTLAKIDTVVFDKTGTLTKGKPTVSDVKIFSKMEEKEFLRLVGKAETLSEHHLGQTIVKEAKSRSLVIDSSNVQGEVLKGLGIKTIVEEQRMIVGNMKLMNQEKILVSNKVEEYAKQKEQEGNTAILVAINHEIVGIISIKDQIREDAKTALQALRKNGVKNIIMLTGDNTHTAKLVAEELQLDAFHAELLPEQKVEYIHQLKADGHMVAMAGDGVNDAPSIASADIGLAMGEGGTDVAMETADVVLMADKLSQFAHAHALAKATVRNIRQNTFLAILVVIILLAGVLFDYIHLASGMFIHEASVLLVIVNAMRLIRFKS